MEIHTAIEVFYDPKTESECQRVIAVCSSRDNALAKAQVIRNMRKTTMDIDLPIVFGHIEYCKLNNTKTEHIYIQVSALNEFYEDAISREYQESHDAEIARDLEEQHRQDYPAFQPEEPVDHSQYISTGQCEDAPCCGCCGQIEY